MLSTVAATLRMPVQLVELLELLIRYVVLFVSYYLQVQRYWAVLPKLGRGYQMRKKTVAALAKPPGIRLYSLIKSRRCERCFSCIFAR